ncbi:hypothetical protein HMI51_04300 [Corallococcus coralloides]|nr:hypothetical protein [Corallococcus coralloides]
MELARLNKTAQIARFAGQAASRTLPPTDLDPLEALLARHPRASPFTELLLATLLLRLELTAWQQALSLPLPGVLHKRKDRNGELLSEVLGYVYHPWVYACEPFARFLDTYGPRHPLDYLFLGLNPGPWGMTQTGIPFTDPTTVRTHLKLSGQVNTPGGTSPRVPVTGLDSKKKEGSAAAISALMGRRWGSVANCYKSGYVMNFCPMFMLDDLGVNVTPADLRVKCSAMRSLRDLCDAYLACVVWIYRPKRVITLGKYAERRLARVLRLAGLDEIHIVPLLHPSSRARGQLADNPLSWVEYADAKLDEATST